MPRFETRTCWIRCRNVSHSNATYAPRRKRENTVVTDAYEAGGCGLDHLARYTVQRRALMSMAMNLRVLYKVGNFLTTWDAINASRKFFILWSYLHKTLKMNNFLCRYLYHRQSFKIMYDKTCSVQGKVWRWRGYKNVYTRNCPGYKRYRLHVVIVGLRLTDC